MDFVVKHGLNKIYIETKFGEAVLLIIYLLLYYFSLKTIFISLILFIFILFLIVMLEIYFFELNTLIIIENNTPIRAIKKSFKIASKNRLNIFIIFALILVIETIVNFISIFFVLIPFLGLIISSIIGFSISVWFGIIPVYFYYSLYENKKPKNIK